MNRARARARAGALVTAALMVVACSGGDDASPTTTVLLTAAPTTAPTTTTTSLPTTTARPVTTATTTAATPTIPPTAPMTTIPPGTEQVKQDVIAAVTASYAAYLDAVRNPTDEAKLVRLPEVMAGAKLELALQVIANIVASGQVAVANPDVPSTITTYDDTFVFDPAAGTASIEFCRVSSDLGVIPGGNPDGTDTIVVDDIAALHERSDFELVNGRWYDANGAVLQTFEGATTCVRA